MAHNCPLNGELGPEDEYLVFVLLRGPLIESSFRGPLRELVKDSTIQMLAKFRGEYCDLVAADC